MGTKTVRLKNPKILLALVKTFMQIICNQWSPDARSSITDLVNFDR